MMNYGLAGCCPLCAIEIVLPFDGVFQGQVPGIIYQDGRYNLARPQVILGSEI
jgi:hypothetical protein